MRTSTSSQVHRVRNYIGGSWQISTSEEILSIRNPATQEVLGTVAAATREDVDVAVAAARAAFPGWSATPPEDRIQYLFRLKSLLEGHFEEVVRITTTENGKTLAESRAELRRGIENIEVACGIPILMQGYNLENVARGIDETMNRQPLGVVAAVTPFNFPAMIPLWFLPYAIACGNTFLLKPSERVPLTMQRIFELIEELKLPAGVVNLVNGTKPAVDALLEHPDVRAISFVGSTEVARYVYAKASANGKRVQCQGGAKNHVVVLPDADIEMSSQVIAESAFGCAGQRCLAVSVAVTVGDAQKEFRDSVADRASSIRVGSGLEQETEMGPVITVESRERIQRLVGMGAKDGAKVIVDGRNPKVPEYEAGNFIRPTILDGLPPANGLVSTEIFGPVLSLVHARDVDEAIEIISRSAYGNAASIFTSRGAAARKFRHAVPAGNIGVNIGVAAPMAYFPFSGWRDSFFGVLHAQGRDAVEFYTDKKVVIERWTQQLSRKF